MTQSSSSSRPALRRAEVPIFLIDAALAATIGALLVTSADRLQVLSGGGLAPETLRLVGLALLPWSVHNWLTSRERPLRLSSFCIHFAVDSFWIVASLVIYLQHFEAFTWFGHALYGPQISTVALVLFVKIRAFQRRKPLRAA